MYNVAMIRFVKKYTSDVKKLLDESISKNITEIENLKNSFLSCKKKKSKIILVGNGGSAATSSHVAVDLTKNAKLRSINFNEADLITCFANDFGYENWIEKALEMYCDKNDLVVLLSASGKSKNILKAALWLKNKKIKFATFSGMKKKNILKRINFNGINIWINSMSYNKVEILHHYILLLIVDLIIKKLEYTK
jgi:D-sedoheptulose 7-phosphate isomerase